MMASPQAVETSQKVAPATDVPATSGNDDGLSRRPRDARLIHLILSAQGIHSYQERVPLQLLDLAYRYTQSVLSDSLRLSSEGYSSTAGTTNNKRDNAAENSITVNSLRQAIASRQDYQFHSTLPKEFMLEQAAEKNRIVLPKIEKSWGVQLPPEKYCLTGTGWNLKDTWDSDEEEGGDGRQDNTHTANGTDEMEEKEEGVESFEDVFGSNADEDQEMGEG